MDIKALNFYHFAIWYIHIIQLLGRKLKLKIIIFNGYKSFDSNWTYVLFFYVWEALLFLDELPSLFFQGKC